MKSSTGVLTINLAAIQQNWRRINQELGSETTAAAVIKANAYGLGAAQVGPALYRAGCREFFVATQEEALAARDFLPADALIFVLGGVRVGMEALFLKHDLAPVLFTLADVHLWQQACAEMNTVGSCAIKINTGMTRLGLDEEEFISLCLQSGGFAHMHVRLVMSHLACADDSEHPLNSAQLAAFEQLVDEAKKILPSARFSLANSSGIFLGAAWHFDLVRPGAALYGINPTPKMASPVVPVVSLQLPILQIRTIKQTATIGYGATAQMEAPARVLVAAGGYADGLHRTIGGKGAGEVGGELLPVIGRISMDTTMFDATRLEGDVSETATVEVCNERLTIDLLAERSGALGYEVLTSLGARYQRHYLPPLDLPLIASGEQ